MDKCLLYDFGSGAVPLVWTGAQRGIIDPGHGNVKARGLLARVFAACHAQGLARVWGGTLVLPELRGQWESQTATRPHVVP